jgi:MFS family permease
MAEIWFAVLGCVVAVHGAARAAWSPCGQSMLASLTPLAERARGSSWRITVASFAVGAISAGAATGALLAIAGGIIPGTAWRWPLVAAVVGLAVTVDASPLRRRLPLTRRQVNEDWMTRYRGWVYGAGFGAQLGSGFITLVACAAIYATLAIEFASGSALMGATIGAAFGATKAATLLPTMAVRDPESLLSLHRRLLRLDTAARRAVVAAQLAVLVCISVSLI